MRVRRSGVDEAPPTFHKRAINRLRKRPLVRGLCGGVSRVAKGADCKSAGYAFVGSSPTSPTTINLIKPFKFLTDELG